jgi:hypothetical protein
MDMEWWQATEYNCNSSSTFYNNLIFAVNVFHLGFFLTSRMPLKKRTGIIISVLISNVTTTLR